MTLLAISKIFIAERAPVVVTDHTALRAAMHRDGGQGHLLALRHADLNRVARAAAHAFARMLRVAEVRFERARKLRSPDIRAGLVAGAAR